MNEGSKLIKEAEKVLNKAGVPSYKIDSQYILAHILGMDRYEAILNKNLKLSQEQKQRFLELVAQRAKRIPLQYLLKKQCFWGRDFYVDETVLIPRFETEILCEKVIDYVRKKEETFVDILDLCAGSGAIGIILALELENARVSAADISFDALNLARKNAESLEARLDFYQGNFLEAVHGRSFDIIVTNPPYISRKELKGLQAEVKFEPVLALDGGEDGLDYFKILAKQGKDYLKKDGAIFCEIGYDQGEKIKKMLIENGFDKVDVLPDMQGLDRIVFASI